jgi:intracellular sulfur oxidation DsrE/DsrF family protein
MSRRTLIALAVPALMIGLGLSLPWARAGQHARATTKHRVVFHVNVDLEERWQEVLTNVENLQKTLGPEGVEIEVVAHGAGIGLVQSKNAALRDRVETIEKTGPVFAACSNTLHKRELTAADLTPGVKIVDSGIAEVVRRQEEGWSYVKLSY